jgi:3-hydroxybutyryl-CoA dehydrogenase
VRLGLRDEASAQAAASRLSAGDALGGVESCELVVESVPEDLALKGEVLSPIAAHFPDTVIASNTSSLSIGDIGQACGAPERTVGTHYWNPPLLMPLVEVIAGPDSRPEAVALARSAVAGCGKRPVLVQRDVPGFIWNRLQHALLREALWIIDNGVATPEAVDEVVRFGNARRWEHVGPFAAAALGGIGTWQRVAGELFPVLSNARDAGDLERALWADEAKLAEIAAARDAGLARDLRAD